MTRTPLPVDAVLPTLGEALRMTGAAVLVAEPGAGKTTRVPPWLLGAAAGEVLVVQPRRMAAVLAARRVADELFEKAGETVGWQVRFDELGGPLTRLRYVTDGVFLRRLLRDPGLNGVGAVVIDELHERRLAMDLALGLVVRLRRERSDLKLLAMSATLDAESLADFVGGPVVRCGGRTHPIALEFAPQTDGRPLAKRVAAAVAQIRTQPRATDAADLLVFLPGAREIGQCHDALGARFGAVVPLHASLPLRDQQRALAAEGPPRVVLATNVAETSLTLPRVGAVIDSGLVRRAGFAAWSGLPSLNLGAISQASATQRAGRAGRVGPGRCVRLYTRFEHDHWPAFDPPEVLRSDLADAVLLLASLGIAVGSADWQELWPTLPTVAAVEQASGVLRRLRALDGAGGITAHGKSLIQLPIHPRLAALAVAAADAGVAQTGALAAALLSERDAGLPERGPSALPQGWSDVQALVEWARGEQELPSTVRQAAQRLHRLVGGVADRLTGHAAEQALARAIVHGFPDRIARRRQQRGLELEMLGVPGLRLDANSHATEPQWLAVLAADERRDDRGSQARVRLASGVEPEWLLDLQSERVEATTEVAWDARTGRAVEVDRLAYDGLTLDETTRPASPSAAATRLLRVAVHAIDCTELCGADAVVELRARLDVLRAAGFAVPDITDELLHETLAGLCEGLTGLAQVRAAGPLAVALTRLDPTGTLRRTLAVHAPRELKLPTGRKVTIYYAIGQPPWIASRLQDFLGLASGPTIAGGRVALTLHLLSPAGRPVQVTNDLEGFWNRHYPALRKALARRYPKHAWPEDPLR
jgi:ATP-dependent helicase HrpB